MSSDPTPQLAVEQTLMRLASTASVEVNVQDAEHIFASRRFLAAGSKLYVSHLPGQTWKQTEEMCRTVHRAGFEAVPHVPARLIESREALDEILGGFVEAAQVKQLLLISGDYPTSVGPYSKVSEVMRTGALQKHGIRSVSVAGHPEGHPKVELNEIRSAEREKVLLAEELNMGVTLVSQFFFEASPFLNWAAGLSADKVQAQIVAGVAGPAGLASLFRFATRCGVGKSIRALGTRPASLKGLLGDHGPEGVLSKLAQARVDGSSSFTGLHLFCFGGFLRTCEWLNRIASGRFQMDRTGRFEVCG